MNDNFFHRICLVKNLSDYPNFWFRRVEFKGAYGAGNTLEEWILLAE